MKRQLSERAVEALLNKHKIENSEKEFQRLPLDYENRALRRVREGDYRDADFLPYDSIKDHLGFVSRNPVRNFEYNTVAGIALFCRAAIEGGAAAEEALDLSDVLLQEVQKAATVEELYGLYQTAEILFAKLVSNSRRSRDSYQVEQCRVYVLKNICKKITVGEIAEHIGLHPNYLSQLFAKAEGITLHDYIQREKMKRAASLLSHSERSISAIALYLGFKSQANFTQVFKKWYAMTPMEYRAFHYRAVYQEDETSDAEG